jgi:hypothetical protein
MGEPTPFYYFHNLKHFLKFLWYCNPCTVIKINQQLGKKKAKIYSMYTKDKRERNKNNSLYKIIKIQSKIETVKKGAT